jgi:hypothetical protein
MLKQNARTAIGKKNRIRKKKGLTPLELPPMVIAPTQPTDEVSSARKLLESAVIRYRQAKQRQHRKRNRSRYIKLDNRWGIKANVPTKSVKERLGWSSSDESELDNDDHDNDTTDSDHNDNHSDGESGIEIATDDDNDDNYHASSDININNEDHQSENDDQSDKIDDNDNKDANDDGEEKEEEED